MNSDIHATTTPADIAVAYIEAFGKGDMSAIAGFLADDVVFESPTVQLTGAAVLEAVGQFAQVVTGVDIIAAYGDDEQALVMYDMHTGPFGTIRVGELLAVRDGRITADRLAFDTHAIQASGAGGGAG
jgi:ketosteroid isomerase-like protein